MDLPRTQKALEVPLNEQNFYNSLVGGLMNIDKQLKKQIANLLAYQLGSSILHHAII